MNLIPYAGFEAPRPMQPRTKAKTSRLSPLQLFRMGWDTQQIATYLLISEEEALRRLTIEGSAAKGLPNPYDKDHA